MKLTNSLAQFFDLYFGDPGKCSMVFSIVFQASTVKKLVEKNYGNSHETHRFDAKHSVQIALPDVSARPLCNIM